MNNSAESFPDVITQVTEKIVDTINSRGLARPGSSILIGVSGGADSVCLLDVLNNIKEANGFKIYAAHLNHGIRGAEAERDEMFVKGLCERLGIRCFFRKVNIPELAEAMKMSEEEAGRTLRYEFFSEVCKENNIDLTATAHNKNDQAETVLMRIIRGCGLNGLRGIKYKREDGVIRPLLDVSRQEIEEYMRQSGIGFITDSTNSDQSYMRNKIRHTLLPMLESEFNPEVISALSGMTANIEQDADFIDKYSARLYSRLSPPAKRDKYRALHIASLKLVESKSIISRMIILCARDEMGSGYALEKKHIDEILRMLDRSDTASVDLPRGLRVTVRYGWLEFMNLRGSGSRLNSRDNNGFCIEVCGDKLYNIDEIGICINMFITDADTFSRSRSEGDVGLDADKLGVKNAEDIKFIVRSRRDGDRITLFKNGNKGKLKKLFIDKKIRAEERERIPVMCKTDGEIVAALGVRVSEKYRLSRSSRNVLAVHYEKYED
ncbi:MAG TPA: tRNA lysidine(34) synthetase TilS [Candidatus Monoglobus merdigallinarum]|uniref:tRNA(Ile)-lysidine synthase n=1 Tax=Candidatus Monoglobus merdigallinarum TaxID=2838698 RepID=A0A9D1PRM5_9FIRM|nr:tRNA lysidine(34) synthetase TilS [Candidatus Monoglobus merdigallinarum]